nr:MAG TPA_asm: Tail fiber family protein [Caudoviricetes sp.]
MNDIGKELNRLKEEDKKLENKKLDKTGGTVTGTINATNLQVGGANVYTTSRKPTSSDIGASPIGHSHDDRYFTEAEMNEKLKTKVSVESGKGLSTNDYTTAEKNKLSGIAAGANAYAHPSSHPATMITEDSTHRFVTDVEKQDFNNKISKDDYEVGSNGTCKTLDSRNDIRLINKSGKYSGINVTGNPTGTDAFYFYDVECMSNDVRIVTAKTAGSPLRIFVGSYISEWLGWKEVFNVDKKPTPSEIGALGATAKAESAKTADAVSWANVSGKPSAFAPSSHTHTKSQITDMPTALKNPTAVKVQLNGGTTEGTNQFTYDGSAAKTINVTPANIGALASGGTAVNSSKLNNKAESSAGTANTIVSRDSAGDVVARLLRTTYADQSTMSGAIAFRTNNSTDNYTRYCNNPSAVRAWLGAITKAQILDMFFPIGTIHFTVQNVNPGTTMGGTWVAWGSGRVPVGVNTGDSSFSTPEKTGGSKTMIHNHGSGTLGANIGAFDTDITSIGYQAGPKRTNDSAFTYGFKGLPIISGSVSNSRIAHNTPVYGATDDSSSSTSNNLQPYITCYMWKRTA